MLLFFISFKSLTVFVSQADNLTAISDTIINGKGFCPFSPHHNSTGIITSQRDYISATSVDSAERNPYIYRILPSDSRVRTLPDSKWLNGNLSLPILTTNSSWNDTVDLSSKVKGFWSRLLYINIYVEQSRHLRRCSCFPDATLY